MRRRSAIGDGSSKAALAARTGFGANVASFVVAALAALTALASSGCRKHEALPPQCEAELALMHCVAEHMTPGPTRPNLNAMRAELERDLEVKGSEALDARCRVDTDSLRLTSGAMCAGAP